MLDYIKNMKNENKAFALVLVVVALGMLYGWYESKPKLSQTVSTQMPTTRAASKVEKVDIEIPKVKVYKKSELSKKVILPEEVKADDNKEVTAVVDVPPSKGGAEVISVINKTTGETTLFAREKPRSLMAFENDKSIALGYGVGTRGTVMKLEGEYGFARVGNFHLSVQAEGRVYQERRETELTGFMKIKYTFGE